jgi:hypothetical protein
LVFWLLVFFYYYFLQQLSNRYHSTVVKHEMKKTKVKEHKLSPLPIWLRQWRHFRCWIRERSLRKSICSGQKLSTFSISTTSWPQVCVNDALLYIFQSNAWLPGMYYSSDRRNLSKQIGKTEDQVKTLRSTSSFTAGYVPTCSCRVHFCFVLFQDNVVIGLWVTMFFCNYLLLSLICRLQQWRFLFI